MKIVRIINNILNSNTYLLYDDSKSDCWLVDIGEVEPIQEIIGNNKIKGVFLTHTHYDHIYGINRLVELFPECIIYTSQHGEEGLFSDKLNFSRYHGDSILFQGKHIKVLKEGDEVTLFPNIVLKAMYTPGHDWSCMCYYTDTLIFTGDSYIPNIKLVTSFPKSNKKEAKKSLDRILGMSKTRHVYPGHNNIHLTIPQ